MYIYRISDKPKLKEDEKSCEKKEKKEKPKVEYVAPIAEAHDIAAQMALQPSKRKVKCAQVKDELEDDDCKKIKEEREEKEASPEPLLSMPIFV